MTMHAIDRKIIEAVIDSALAAGYTLRVNDGEAIALGNSDSKPAILAAMFSTDEDYLIFLRANHSCGWARFIYGNEPGVVLADHTDSATVNEILKAANALADGFESERDLSDLHIHGR